jgi:hypothetical protein
LGEIVSHLATAVSGFLVSEIDPAIRTLQDLSAESDQTEVLLGPHSGSRGAQAHVSRVSEIEDLAERSL